MSIDINCDMGESYGRYELGHDEMMIEYISSANIACGFHAGDCITMRKTVRLCLGAGVAIGAHPGYPDIQGFGRRSIQYTPEEIYTMVLYQTGALKSIAGSEGGVLRHVKPHGAMYNDAARDSEAALAIAEAVRRAGDDIILLCLHGSLMEQAAIKSGIRFASEAFADRQYNSDGKLVPRSEKGSVISNPSVCAARTISIAVEKRIVSSDGSYLHLNADSVCVHGDTQGAVDIARAINDILSVNGVPVKPFTGRRQ